jgi:hypothetical protein
VTRAAQCQQLIVICPDYPADANRRGRLNDAECQTMARKPHIFAVLSGDVIKSAKLTTSELDTVRTTVLQSAGQIKQWRRGIVQGSAEFFRGDAWQLLLHRPELCLRAAVCVRARLRAVTNRDTRIAIGIGPVDQIRPRRISTSTGEAFELSGHALDQLTIYQDMTCETPESAGIVRSWLPIVCHLCDAQIRQWTQRQAEICHLAATPATIQVTDRGLLIRDFTHEEIGQRLNPPVAKQTVTRALSGAHWRAIDAAIQQCEATNWAATVHGHG